MAANAAAVKYVGRLVIRRNLGLLLTLDKVAIPTRFEALLGLECPETCLARTSHVHSLLVRGEQKCHTTASAKSTSSWNALSIFKCLHMLQAIMQEAEKQLEEWKHPDPYRPPTAPGGMISQPFDYPICNTNDYSGSKYERNLPVPNTDRESANHKLMRTC